MALISSTVPAGLGMLRPLQVAVRAGRGSASGRARALQNRRVACTKVSKESSEGHHGTAHLPSLPLPPQLAPLASKSGAIAGAALLSSGLSWLASTPAAQAAVDGAVSEAASAAPPEVGMGMGLLVYAAQTAISWGVPTAAGLFLVLVATARRGSPKKGSSDKGSQGQLGFLNMFNPKAEAEEGTPKEYLTITPLNEVLDSYSYSLTKTTGNKAKATAEARRRTYKEKFGDTVGDLSDDAIEKVLKAEKEWRKEASKAKATVDDISKSLRALAFESAESGGDSKDGESKEGESKGGLGGLFGKDKKKELQKKLSEAVAARAAVDDKYLLAVSKALTKSQRASFAKMMQEKTAPGWEGLDDPVGLSLDDKVQHKKAFVLKFNGDVQASQVKNLRQEVTAVIRNASKDDEVVLILNTGGGTVTGYGLAAAQLTRLKDAGLKLNICVEQVAASGGYMMACTADKIYASPFAVLGSIGVISEQPNLYERLKREGVEFQTVTAGKYKRTLTPFKKVAEEDLSKSKEDIEQVLVLFKDFVSQQRPQVNIDEVATGETWFGPDALTRGLVDELKTVDDVLLDLMDAGAELFSVSYAPKQSPLKQLIGSPAAEEGAVSPLAGLIESAAATFAAAAVKQMGTVYSPGSQGMAAGLRLEDPANTKDSILAMDSDSPDDLWDL